jgi:lipoate-protein ligase B
VVWLGRTDYEPALELQMSICSAKKCGFEPDVLLLLEHPPTITLGRNGKWHHLLVSEEALRARGVRRFETDRGGDITYHGPGQLVGYPLLKLEGAERDVRLYMHNLEECLIRMLRGTGIEASRDPKHIGVWTPDGKIAAMGVHISRWITRHGFALNVSTDLSYYDLIVPCGIVGKGVTSMGAILGRRIELREAAGHVAAAFGEVFRREVVWKSAEEMGRELLPVPQGVPPSQS